MALAFAPHLEVIPLEGRGVVVIGEFACEVYSGEQFGKIGLSIDGAREENDVLAAAGDGEREELADALTQLKRAGVVVQAPNGALHTPDARWWSSQRVSPDVIGTRLREAAVRVVVVGDVDPQPTIDAFGDAVVAVRDDAPLTVVLAADYLDAGLRDINEQALTDGRQWMLAQPHGARILIGPVFSPDRGPCWECLAERLRYNRSIERRARWVAGVDGSLPPVEGPGAQRRLGPALIATEALRWITGTRPDFESTLLAFDGRTLDISRHRVQWRPQCEACGAGESEHGDTVAPVRIHRDPRAHTPGLRAVAPQKTLERFGDHVSTITGVVQNLSRRPGPDYLHAYVAGGPIARIHGERQCWEPLADMPSGGKGTTDAAARASALCEALERYCGGFRGGEPRRRGLFEELEGDAIAPNDYMRFSERQFAQRHQHNERATSFRTRIPEPFDPTLPIEWSPVWSLTHERTRWLPTALCYYGAQVLGAPFCIAESNGNAAGNTVEEAILHGFLELVERDHVALWWYNRIAAPGVALDTVADPWLAQLREYIAGQGRELWAVDLTADLGIPAAAALVASEDGSGIGMGFGAHLDLRSAVIRAATELAQLGLGSVSGGLGSGADPALHLDDHPFARPDPDVPLRSCEGEPSFEGDVVDALERCRRTIEGKGLELLVLDQTRPDIGLPVVKVIVPGMRHFWPRLGTGRLYEVPVSLGRLAEPRREDELNHAPPVV